jgi:hypothetical protein
VSHSETYKDTGATSSFYQGLDAGIKKEQKRILDLLRDRRTSLLKGNYLETANIYQSAINLIEGGNK